MKSIFIILFLLGFISINWPYCALAQLEIDNKKVIYGKEVCDIEKYYWIIYDNRCPYCRSATKYIKELDWEKKFKFISYREPLTYKIFPKLSKEECEKDVHMVTPKGEVLVGYEVFRTVIDNLTATKLLNPLLKNDYAEKKLNEIYEKMAKERSCYYNKSGTCELNRETQKVTGLDKAKTVGQKEKLK